MDESRAVVKARAFVSEVGASVVPVRVEAYLEHINAVLHPQTDMEPDEAGCSFSSGGKQRVNSKRCERVGKQSGHRSFLSSYKFQFASAAAIRTATSGVTGST